MKNPKDLLLLASIVAITVILFNSVNWWFFKLLKLVGFIDANSDLIQGIEAFIQILILIAGFMILVGRAWLSNSSDSRKKHSSNSEAIDKQGKTLNNYPIRSKYIGAVGQNNKVLMNIDDTLPEDKQS